MKLIIHDLEKDPPLEISQEIKIISAKDIPQYCRGCFNCWVKTPGQCVIKDGYDTIGKDLSASDEVVIVSRCTYGSVSPLIKRVIDRSIGYAHPFFITENKEMHHKRRYSTHFKLKILFYGETTDIEKNTAVKFAELLKKKYTAVSLEIKFYDNAEMIKL